MKLSPDAAFATRCIHAGQSPDPTTGAIMTPIYQTSTYVQSGPGEHKGFVYARGHNPTRNALQDNLASLEGAAHGLTFASGCAAEAVTVIFSPSAAIGRTVRSLSATLVRLAGTTIDPACGPCHATV